MLIKSNRFLLILCVIFLSVIVLVGCSNDSMINVNYIEIGHNKNIIENKSSLIYSKNELYDFVDSNEVDKFEKYNDEFFTKKSIIIFINFETSSGNRSVIKSYKINNNEINIIVETEDYGQILSIAYYYYILEVDKDAVAGVKKINIIKNGENINTIY